MFGGNQMRPNLHIEDMVDAYLLMLEAPHEKIHGETFNIGFQNHSIAEIANIVKKVVEEEMPDKGEIEIVTTPSNDIRSYHVNSDKVARVLGFGPKRNIEDAVRDLTRAFRNHLLPQQLRRRLVLQRPHDEEARREMSGERKTAVVTGGAGFIGSHMVDLLVERGYRVRVIDNLVGGREANIAQHTPAIRTSFSKRPTFAAISPATRCSSGVDYVFHFAGIGDIVPSIERPLEYMAANVQGTVHMLECARHAGVEEIRLCRVVVLLWAGRHADARGPSARAAISLCAEQVSRRAGGLSLAQGL